MELPEVGTTSLAGRKEAGAVERLLRVEKVEEAEIEVVFELLVGRDSSASNRRESLRCHLSLVSIAGVCLCLEETEVAVVARLTG